MGLSAGISKTCSSNYYAANGLVRRLCLSASTGIAPRSALIMTLCFCSLFAATTTGQALTPVQRRNIEALSKDVPTLTKKLLQRSKNISALSREIKLLPGDAQGLVIWLMLAGLAGAAAAGCAGAAGIGKKTRTPARPDVIRSIEPGVREPQDADLMVIAPALARPREAIIAQVIVHTPEREAEAQSRALKLEPHGQQLALVPLTIQLEMNDAIKVTLDCDRAKITEPVQSAFWNGRYVVLQFVMQLPDTESELSLISKLRVFVNSIPAGNVIFRITVSPNAPDAAPSFVHEHVHRYRRPFLSYAKEDRVEVLKAAQLIKALKMTFFQDVLSIEPAERWEHRLYQEIEHCDVFLLFWSHHASASEWVLKEAEQALQLSNSDKTDPRPEICLYLLEGPPAAEPPASLRELNFNDPARYAILWEIWAKKKRELRRRLALGGLLAAILVFVPSVSVVATFLLMR
jgi:TIR domain